MDKKIMKNFLMFFSGSFLMSILLYIYQILMSRFLNVGDYGNLISIISYYTIICIPIFALGIFLTKYLSKFHEEGDFDKIEVLKYSVEKNLIKIFGYYYFLVFFILFLFSNILKIDFLEIIILLLSSFALLYFSYKQSINYATKNTKLYSLIGIIDISLRIGFGILLVFLGYGYIGAFLGFLIGNILAFILNIYLSKKNYEINKDLEDSNKILDYNEIKSFIVPVIFFASFGLIINNIDIILAKSYLDGENLGYYSSIIIISRILIFGLSIFSGFIVPYLTDYKKYKKIISIIYFFIIFSGIISIGLFYLFPNFIISLLFGDKYLIISDYLFYGAIIGFIYVILNLVMNHFILIGKNKYAYIGYIFISILIGIITFFSPNDFENFVKYIMYSYMISFFILLGFLGYDFIKIKKINLK